MSADVGHRHPVTARKVSLVAVSSHFAKSW